MAAEERILLLKRTELPCFVVCVSGGMDLSALRGKRQRSEPAGAWAWVEVEAKFGGLVQRAWAAGQVMV